MADSEFLRNAFRSYAIAFNENKGEEIIPCRTKLTKQIIPFCKNKWEDVFNLLERKGTCFGITVTLDGRSNILNDPLIVIMLETHDTHLLYKVINAGLNKKTGIYISNLIKDVM